jgi:hypothetical protein
VIRTVSFSGLKLFHTRPLTVTLRHRMAPHQFRQGLGLLQTTAARSGRVGSPMRQSRCGDGALLAKLMAVLEGGLYWWFRLPVEGFATVPLSPQPARSSRGATLTCN